MVSVDKVDADGRVADAGLARSGIADRDFFVNHDVGSADGVNANGIGHGFPRNANLESKCSRSVAYERSVAISRVGVSSRSSASRIFVHTMSATASVLAAQPSSPMTTMDS